MSRPDQYDDFADLYAAWTASAPITELNLPFYVDEYVATDGLVVELGVGDGRIAVEAARRGKALVGVDASRAMLDLCRARAEEAGVADRVQLLHADMRDFELEEPAALVTIPFHSIGHLLTLDDKRDALRHAHGQLAPGGRLILDHFVFDASLARSGIPMLRGETPNEATGGSSLLWAVPEHALAAKQMVVRAITEELDATGVVTERRVRRLSFSWIDPEEVRALLTETGFEVDAVYGDFDRTPFGPDSSEQIWLASRGA
jgi:SAM-dependent methyltransferase